MHSTSAAAALLEIVISFLFLFSAVWLAWPLQLYAWTVIYPPPLLNQCFQCLCVCSIVCDCRCCCSVGSVLFCREGHLQNCCCSSWTALEHSKRNTKKTTVCNFQRSFSRFSLSVTVINDGPAHLLLFHEYQQQKQHLSRTVMLVFSISSSSTEQIKLCLCSNREWLCFTVSFTSHFFWRWITAAKSAD